MGNKRKRKRKFDHTRGDTCHNELSKEYYRRKKQERANIEGTSDDNVIRDLHLDDQQEEMELGTCIHIIYIMFRIKKKFV
jgi:hypothetical protein